MTDLATLTITIDTRSVAQARGDLKGLSTAARDTETAVRNMAAAFRTMAGQVGTLTTALNEVNGAAGQAKAGYWDWVERLANLTQIAAGARNLQAFAQVLPRVSAASAEVSMQTYIAEMNLKHFSAMAGRSATTSNLAAAGARGLALAARGASAAMAFFGGPIGLAITAVGIGLGILADKAQQTAIASQQMSAEGVRVNKALDEYEAAAMQAATASGDAKAKAIAHANALRQEALEAIRAAKALREKALAAAEANQKKVEREVKGRSWLAVFGEGGEGMGVAAPAVMQLAEAERAVVEQRQELQKVTKEMADADKRYAGILGMGAPGVAALGATTRDTADAARDYIQRLREETEEIGLTEAALRQLQDTRAKATATPEQAAEIDRLAALREKKIQDADQARQVVEWNNRAAEALNDLLDQMEYEQSLLGKTAEERGKLIGLHALEEAGIIAVGTAYEKLSEREQGLVGVHVDAEVAKAATAEFERQLGLLQEVDAQAQRSAQNMAQAFGSVGSALGGLTSEFSRYAVQRKQLEGELLKGTINQAQYAERTASAQIEHYGNVAAAAKGFFKEGTAGYALMSAAEKAFRLVEFAMSVKAIATKTAETGTKISLLGAEAQAAAATGAANMFASLGPLGFAAVAAMVAVLATFGLRSGGSGASAPTFDLEAKQKAQGAGSVFGDSSLKSESIQNALEGSLDVQEKMVGYQNTMVGHLRSIDSKIAGFARVLTRSIVGGRLFSTDGLNLGETSTRGLGAGGAMAGGILGGAAGFAAGGALAGFGASSLMGIGMGAGLSSGMAMSLIGAASWLGPVGIVLGALAPLLFSSKTTRTLQDQGLQFPDQTVGQIMGSGAQGSAYQQVLENTKKKFAGITYSDKNRTVTDTTALDDDTLAHIDLIVGALRTGVLSAARTLGLDGAEATIDAFKVSLGQISLKDMTGEEIQETLNAVFGKLADDMAGAVAGGMIEKYQLLGEGAFETMVRLANGVELVKAQLTSVGLAFDYVGAAAVEASQALIDAAGGMDSFADGMAYFREHFLTEAEQMAPRIDRVTAAMADMGLSWVDTIEEFKAKMNEALTTNNVPLFTGLFAIQEDFYDTVTYKAKALEDKTKETVEGLAAAFTAQLSAVRGALDDWTGIKNKLLDFQKSLTSGDLSGASGKQSLAMARQAFEKVAARVAAKDRGALDELPGAGKAYIDALKASARTPEELARGLNRVKAVVGDATSFAGLRQDEAITQLNNINSSVIAVRDAILEMANVPAELAAMVRQGLPGFANGGGFTVGGSGGVDSQLVMFRATPGEVVDIHNGRTPQNLGLMIAANSNGNAAEIAALRADINGLRADNQALMRRVAEATEKTNITLRRVTRDGDSLVTTAA